LKRREFITLLGGAAATWPARAQQAERVRRIGILAFGTEDDPFGRFRRAAFLKVLQDLGWVEGRNLRTDVRLGWDVASLSAQAGELVSLTPDVIVAISRGATIAAQRRTQSIPIVFMGAGADPVTAGLVSNIARPEGNITGITNTFNSMGGKWVELLKEAAPRTTRVAGLADLEYSNENQQMPAIEAAGAMLGVRTTRIAYHNPAEIERAIEAFAVEPNGALIVTPAASLRGDNVAFINRLALQYRLPAVYPNRRSLSEGGLMSYGPDDSELPRVAGGYVDRILRGAKPGDLPVQYPTKLELAVNLKTAKAIGLTIPESLLQRADEVIE
jgi:putative tryptophan/tyrosine transport system substrate-binding protein